MASVKLGYKKIILKIIIISITKFYFKATVIFNTFIFIASYTVIIILDVHEFLIKTF